MALKAKVFYLGLKLELTFSLENVHFLLIEKQLKIEMTIDLLTLLQFAELII